MRVDSFGALRDADTGDDDDEAVGANEGLTGEVTLEVMVVLAWRTTGAV